MKLEDRGLGTGPCAREGAASLIALPDCTPARRRFVASDEYSRAGSAAVRPNGQFARCGGRLAASIRDPGIGADISLAHMSGYACAAALFVRLARQRHL
jgi:hypothetical protein